jgi:hypothetical protein
MRKQVIVRFIDETEGAFRYREVNSAGDHIHGDREGSLVGDIYIRKMAMAGKRPEQITVTIEYRD